MARMSVDLPDPEAPISATISPAVTVTLMSFSTGAPAWKDLATPTTSIAAVLKRGAPSLVSLVAADT